MVLDPATNFVRGDVDASIGAGDSTISVVDASTFPDPGSVGNYNLVLWNAGSFDNPFEDSDVEIVRVTGRDSNNDNLTVSRGQESTTDTAHAATSALQNSWTAKMRDDAETEFSRLESDKADRPTVIDDTDSPYTTSDDDTIVANTANGAVTVTLASADATDGNVVHVVNAGGSNDVTVNTEGSETIDPGSASSKTISEAGWVVSFTSDGADWDASAAAEFESATITNLTSTDVTTSTLQANGETFVHAILGSNISSISSNTWTNILDTEQVDNRGEFDEANGQFSPDESGWYIVKASAQWFDIADGDQLGMRVRNVTDGTTLTVHLQEMGGSDTQFIQQTDFVDLDSSKTYEIQSRNADSTASISTGTNNDQTKAFIVRSVVHP